MNNERRHNSFFLRHASVPAANYVITPKSLVCPGRLSTNVSSIPVKPQSKETPRSSLKSSKQFKISLPQQVESITPASALTVYPRQGVFEIHLKSLDLSKVAMQHIASQSESEEDESPTIRISWKFLSFERSAISLQISSDPHCQIESSVIYKVDINDDFCEYLYSRFLSLELYARVNGKETYIARGELGVSDVLEYPLNELYAYVDMCDVDKALVLSNTGITIVYGTLTLWYRLSCDIDVLRTYLNKRGRVYYGASTSKSFEKLNALPIRGKSSLTDLSRRRSPDHRQYSFTSKRSLNFQLPIEIYEETESVNTLEPTDSEVDRFKEALDLVLSRNKALKITQSEISNELRDRTRWLHEESNWKRTLQEYAILRGRNPGDVQWRQWRDAETANVKLRRYSSQTIVYKPEVLITIEHLTLYKHTPPMLNDRLKKFYVEFAFLGHNGVDMECPFSLPKPLDAESLCFNFSKRFCIDPEENPEDANALAEAVKSGGKIKFSVVGEPEPNRTEFQCCEEVSSCSLDLLELVQMEDNSLSDSLVLYDIKDAKLEIGYLRVKINGVLAMRRCALQILAPPGYKIL